MKKKLTEILMILGVFVTLSILLYPTVSEYINSHNQSRAVTRHLDDVVNMDKENIQEMLKAAHEYNVNLLSKQNRFNLTEEERLEYDKQLDTGRGVMGILAINKMNIKLPVYHGTENEVL